MALRTAAIVSLRIRSSSGRSPARNPSEASRRFA